MGGGDRQEEAESVEGASVRQVAGIRPGGARGASLPQHPVSHL